MAEWKLAFHAGDQTFLLPPLSLQGIVDLKAKQPFFSQSKGHPMTFHTRDHWNAG